MALTFVSRRLAEATGGILSGHEPLGQHLELFLVQSVIIIAMCRSLSLVGWFMHQPQVIFEITGGIILGPSAIGRNQDYLNKIFPHSSLDLLKIVADIGLVLYLFLVGLELDVPKLATHAKKAGSIAVIGMAVPFALGIGISKTLFNNLQGSDPKYKDVDFPSFFVFIGTALSITAFPVLARLLKAGGLLFSKAGALTMGAAALNDAIAWCLLILSISIANAGNMGVAGLVFISVVAFGVGLAVVVRPIFKVIIDYCEQTKSKAMRNNLFALTLCLVFLSSWTTALLGVDAIFGAFLFGLIVPRHSQLFHDCNEFIEELVTTFTLPIYFALSGLKTDVTQIHSKEEGAMIVLVCFIATIGKLIGCGGTALLSGMSFRESAAVAWLMNTRGLVELIVLNLGMSAGILNVKTFSVMVIMCLFTTFITSPIVQFIYPPHLRESGDEDVKSSSSDPSYAGGSVSTVDRTIINDSDIMSLSSQTRLSLVVDKMEHLQPLMDLVVSFTPWASGSSLNLTAIRLVEPTMTEHDELVALNDDNRLIQVESEATSLCELTLSDPHLRLPKLLPLSMLCTSLGISVKSFTVKGDPSEFSLEVSNLSAPDGSQAHSQFVIFPWRSAQYNRKLFWGTVHKVHTPVALFCSEESFVDTITSPNTELNEIEVSAQSSKLTRSTAGSSKHPVLPPQEPAASTVDTLSKQPISRILVVITGNLLDRYIIHTLYRFLENRQITIKLLLTSDRKEYPPALRNDITKFRAAFSTHENVSVVKLTATTVADVDRLVGACYSATKIQAAPQVVPPPAVSSRPLSTSHSSSGDLTTEAKSHEKEEDVVKLPERAISYPNLFQANKKAPVHGTSHAGAEEPERQPFDLCLHSFTDPFQNEEDQDSAMDRRRMNRSNTMADMVKASKFNDFLDPTDVSELTSRLGIPVEFIGCGQPYVELGALGFRLLQLKSTNHSVCRHAMILHLPRTSSGRRMTIADGKGLLSIPSHTSLDGDLEMGQIRSGEIATTKLALSANDSSEALSNESIPAESKVQDHPPSIENPNTV